MVTFIVNHMHCLTDAEVEWIQPVIRHICAYALAHVHGQAAYYVIVCNRMHNYVHSCGYSRCLMQLAAIKVCTIPSHYIQHCCIKLDSAPRVLHDSASLALASVITRKR